MFLKLPVVVGFCFVLVGPGRTQGDEPVPAAVGQLAPAVVTVSSGGYWERGSQQAGWYRLVICQGGSEHVHEQVYLQWIRQGSGASEADVIERTVRVAEIGSHWRVTSAHFVLGGKAKIVVTTAGEDFTTEPAKSVARYFTISPRVEEYAYDMVESESAPTN